MNRKNFLGFVAAIFIFAFLAGAAFAQTTDGLIGYWKFDGNGNNEVSGGTSAVKVGSAEFKSSGGQSGGYLYVNTSSDWGKIPYSSTFDLANSFTVEFWFRQRANQSFNQNFVYKGNGQNNYNFLINRWLWNEYNQGPVIAGSTAFNTGYWHQASNPNQLAHGQWHHVVYTRDLTYQAYYLDGILWGSRNLTSPSESADYGGPVKTPAVDIIIGDTAVDTDFDNLRIYNRVLSYLEVTQNGGFPAPTTTTTMPTSTTTTISRNCAKSDTTDYLNPNLYTKGTCTNSTGSFEDFCNSGGNSLTEYLCVANNITGVCFTTTASCPNGCTNGACLRPPPNATTTSQALLGGNNANSGQSGQSNQGAGGGSSQNTVTTSPATTTTSSSSATSNACSVPNGMGFYSNGLCVINYCNSGYYNCDGNYVNGCESMSPCSTSSANGTPAGKKQTCTDTDGGISTYSRGFTTGSDGQISEDKCSENNLTEYYCKDGQVSEYTTSCGNGCNDGACVSPIAKLIQDLITLIKSIFGIK